MLVNISAKLNNPQPAFLLPFGYAVVTVPGSAVGEICMVYAIVFSKKSKYYKQSQNKEIY